MPLDNLLPFTPPEEAVRPSRSGFETIPPDLSKAELFRYFTYSADDRAAIFECRGNKNKVGFALLLSSVRLTGRFPVHFDLLPASLLAHVSKQLKIEGLLFLDYPQRPATLHKHKERIKAYLGLRNFEQEAHQAFVTELVQEQVRAGLPPDDLTERAEEQLRSLQFVLPGVTVLQKLISAALTQAEAELYQAIGQRLMESEKAAILDRTMGAIDRQLADTELTTICG